MTTRAHASRLAAALAILSLSACGKPLLYVEVEIPSAEVLLARQTFPSTVLPAVGDLCPPGSVVTPGASCLQRTFGFDLGNDFRDLTKDAARFDLRLLDLSIALDASDPLGDFRDVEFVVVGIDGTPLGLPDADLAFYRKDPAVPAPQAITVSARANVDLGKYLQDGQVSVFAHMEFGRDIPAFTADVTADFYLKALVDYGKVGGIY